MKKYFILALTLLNSGYLFSQTYKINWENNTEYALTNGQKYSVPFFNNPSHYVLNEYNMPNFNLVLDGRIHNLSIKIINSTPLNSQELIQFNGYDLVRDEIKFSKQIISENNLNKTYVSIFPYYKKDNTIYKIESFSVEKLPNVQNRSTDARILDDSRSSVLKSGEWFKIKVDKTGVFKLDKRFFTANGIPTSGYNLNTLKIYGNGSGRLFENTTQFRYGALQQIPIEFVGAEDNSFDTNDYITFYAKGPHQWFRDNNTTLSNIFNRFNLYDDYSYYYITFNGTPGKRIEQKEVRQAAVQTFTTFDDYQFHEKDSLNINQQGRQWVGEMLNGSKNFEKKFTFKTPPTNETAYLNYSLVGKNAGSTSAAITLNSNNIANVNFGSDIFDKKSGTREVSLSGNEVNLSVNYTNSSNPAGVAFVDYFELKYKAQLQYPNQQFNFRRLENLNDGRTYGFNLANNNGVKVWDVSDIASIYQILPEGNTFKYNSTSQDFYNEFVAFKDEHLLTDVTYVGRVNNQDIRSLEHITLAIITHPNLKEQAMRLAQFREANNNIKVAVVTTDEIYNDFSSGSKDPIAIRDFLKHLKDNGNPLEYAILFGATTYDPKDRVQGNINLVPTFYSYNSSDINGTYASDDFFAMLGDEVNFALDEGNGHYSYNANWIDIAIGRIPATNLNEAKVQVDKIISYYQKIPNKGTSFGDWRTRILAVSDDPEEYYMEVNTPKFDGDINRVFQLPNNNYYAVNKLYVDAFQPEQTSAGLRYPMINQSIINSFELGTNFIMYYGHGGPRSWAQERIITGEELTNLSNFTNTFARVPIVATITCDFTVWDLPQYNSAGEMMLKNPNGGALSMMTTNRPIGTTYGSDFNEHLVRELFTEVNHQNVSTGKALVKAKQSYAVTSINNAKVNLLGDPMVSISRPKQDVKINTFKVNGEVVNYSTHQIKALDFVEIEGEVLSLNQTLDQAFNGNIQNILYEKPVTRALRNNKGHSGFSPYSFTEEFKTIFKGSSKVENGKFTIRYYVPKDINYEVGERKLVLYAYSDTSDAVTTEKVVVGGLNEDGIQDNEIPQGKLYMNNLNFANGGITDHDPYLVACLTDNTGINATGASIGHDIVATLDGKVQESIVLNEYFESGDGNPCIHKNLEDYQKGQVLYQLKNLELGQHQVQVKFWDINNNSNTASLDFVVMESGSNQLHIDKLLNWPNPFTHNTFFHFEHNCDTELEVLVQIYTVSGKLVKTIKQHVSSEPFREGYRTGKYAIEWDGLDDFGEKIGKGTYLYKVNVKGVDSELCNGTATAIERLVILK